ILLQVKAPLKVPQLRGLITGELSEEEFIHGIFGNVFPYPEELLYDPAGLLKRSVVVSEAGEADIRFSINLPFVPGQRDALKVETGTMVGSSLSKLGIEPSWQGLGKWPLLS